MLVEVTFLIDFWNHPRGSRYAKSARWDATSARWDDPRKINAEYVFLQTGGAPENAEAHLLTYLLVHFIGCWSCKSLQKRGLLQKA